MTATGIAGSWVESELEPGRQLFNDVVQCGDATRSFLSSYDPQDAVRYAIQGAFTCHTVYKTVRSDLDLDASDETEARRALELGDRFTARLRIGFEDIARIILRDR